MLDSVEVMQSWRESIVDALMALGGEGMYDEIYAEVAARRESLPPSWQAVVRRTIQQSSADSAAYLSRNGDMFYSVAGLGNGRWGIRAERPERAAVREGIAENPGTGQGHALDSVVRRAIEQHAVRTAVNHYVALGAQDIEELGKPYDLRVDLGDLEVHVEVKGSTRSLDAVTLTRNEVLHARETPGTQLFVVDEIELVTDESGLVSTRGGRTRVWTSWVPSDRSLTATVFTHSLDA